MVNCLFLVALLLGGEAVAQRNIRLAELTQLQLEMERGRMGGGRGEVLGRLYKQLRDSGAEGWGEEALSDCWYGRVSCSQALGSVEQLRGAGSVEALRHLGWLSEMEGAHPDVREAWLREGLRGKGRFGNRAFSAQAVVKFGVEALIDDARARSRRMDWWIVSAELRLRSAGTGESGLLRLVGELVARDAERRFRAVGGSMSEEAFLVRRACGELRRHGGTEARLALPEILKAYEEGDRARRERPGRADVAYRSAIRVELARTMSALGDDRMERLLTGESLVAKVGALERTFASRPGGVDVVRLVTGERDAR